MKWTPAALPELDGRVVVVTGANSGLGERVAHHVAMRGATVVMAVRDLRKGERAAGAIRGADKAAGGDMGRVRVMHLDLSVLKSVRVFATAFRARYRRLDLLVNNAGVSMLVQGLTGDGFERHFETNYLGHFLLTGLLLDRLTATPASRIVNVSSVAHGAVDDVDYAEAVGRSSRAYNSFRAYGRSKLANLLFTTELSRRLAAAGARTLAVACHPGIARTSMVTKAQVTPLHLKGWWLLTSWLLTQDAEKGAWPILLAMTDPQAKHNNYYGPTGLFQYIGTPGLVKQTAAAKDAQKARKLWEWSAKAANLQYLS